MIKLLALKFFTILFLLSSIVLYAEDVSITIYYPFPYGTYKQLSIDDGGGEALRFGSFQITREFNVHLASHAAFIRNGTSRMGLGYKQSSDTFGFGPGTTGAFDPTYLAIDSTGKVGLGTISPAYTLHVPLATAVTNTVIDIIQINHSLAGASAVGFGSGLVLSGKSDSVDARPMARIRSAWTNPADATRASSLEFQTATAGADPTTKMTIDNVGAVGIGTAGPANIKSILELNSPDKGFLPPRMTTINRDAITTPPAGLLIYNTTTKQLEFYNGTVWVAWSTVSSPPYGVGCGSANSGTASATGYFPIYINSGSQNICEGPGGCRFSVFATYYHIGPYTGQSYVLFYGKFYQQNIGGVRRWSSIYYYHNGASTPIFSNTNPPFGPAVGYVGPRVKSGNNGSNSDEVIADGSSVSMDLRDDEGTEFNWPHPNIIGMLDMSTPFSLAATFCND